MHRIPSHLPGCHENTFSWSLDFALGWSGLLSASEPNTADPLPLPFSNSHHTIPTNPPLTPRTTLFCSIIQTRAFFSIHYSSSGYHRLLPNLDVTSLAPKPMHFPHWSQTMPKSSCKDLHLKGIYQIRTANITHKRWKVDYFKIKNKVGMSTLTTSMQYCIEYWMCSTFYPMQLSINK